MDEEDVEEGSEELETTSLYVAEETPECRRQWCVELCCYYFGAQGVDKAIKAAEAIEKYLIGTRPKQVK